MKKKYLLVIIGTLLVLSLLLGTSYAYWSLTHKQTNENLVNSGCFATTFTEVKESTINLTNSYPMTDEDGMKTKPYEFTITNTCDTYASYNINMEVLSSTTLSHELIKAVLDDNTPKVATEYESTTAITEGASSYILLSGGLDADESKSFNFRMWIDEVGTVDNAQNKMINAKIVVITSASETPFLTTILLNQYQSGTSNGLIRDDNNTNLYYFTGTENTVSNNYLWYGGHQWRVIEFDVSAKTLTLITQQPLTAIQPNDNIWTTEEEYNLSYMNRWLNDYFWNSLDESVQNNIINTNFNVGSESLNIFTTKKVGLLHENLYLRAGGTDSFLDIKDNWWLGNSSNLTNIRNVDANGSLVNYAITSASGVRAVVTISDLIIDSGNGTIADNFRLESSSTDIDSAEVGEYINIPYEGNDGACGTDRICTFRIISKDGEKVKIILNGLLSQTSAWAADAKDDLSTADTIYTNVLNTFIANIDNKYILSGDFGVGIYEDGDDYSLAKNVVISSNVGVPTVGELFSGNDINVSTSDNKVFVDVNTIENPNVASFYWTMNRYSTARVRYVDRGCLNKYYPISNPGGVRPVIYLKSDLSFTGGEGTPQNPYTLD